MNDNSKTGVLTPENKGHPDEKVAPLNDLCSNNSAAVHPLKPKSQRELRGLIALVKSENGVMRYDMDVVMGAQNSPEYISRLRVSGWAITTERVPIVDRDGRRVHAGRYFLSLRQRELASRLLGV